MVGKVKFVMTCRLCKTRVVAPVLDGVRAGMTEDEARDDVMGRMIRAENDFFRDHWQRKHSDKAAEIPRHIALVTTLARVSAYHKRVLDFRFEGFEEGPARQ
jgi:hypothetical protein